jgi:aminoglycoside phosphotransferase (APT) family kinase protein
VRKEDITVEVVGRLVADQFPEWAQLTIRHVELDGWDNTTFRLGDELAIRLPSHERYVAQIDKEHRWLPELAGWLPLPIPAPVAKGAPTGDYPLPWSVYRWIDGETAATAVMSDPDRLAAELADFLVALRRAPTDGGPPAGPHSCDRGGPVRVWDDQTRAAIDLLVGQIDEVGALAVWEAALGAEWAGPDVWVHGDVTGSNLLLRDGRLCAVIDFGCMAVGDPACDLTPAWTMFDGSSRHRFLSRTGDGEGTRARARGWALWKALVSVAGRSTSDPHRTGARFGWRWDALGVIDQVVSDHRAAA